MAELSGRNIKDGVIRDLTHVVGHAADGKWGRKAVADFATALQAENALAVATGAAAVAQSDTNLVNIVRAAGQAHIAFDLVGSALGLRGLPQGHAIDEVNRDLYLLYGFNKNIDRFDLDGPPQQSALDGTLAATSIIGHSILAVENRPDGTVKLWAPHIDKGTVFRFSYVAGAVPNDNEKYVLFPTDALAENFTTVCITYDQQFLVAINPGPTTVKVYRLADLISGGPGNYVNNALYEWDIPGDQFPGGASVYPLQDHCSDGKYLYAFAGLGNNAATNKPKIYAYDLVSGRIVSRGDGLTFGLADAATIGSPTYSEPEGLKLVSPGEGKRPILSALVSQNDVSGQRINRIYYLGQKRRDEADLAWARYLKAAGAAKPTSTRQALIRSVYDELAASDVLSRLAWLYLLANDTSARSRINLIRPGVYTATVNGAPTFTADRGFAGDGTAAYLSLGVAPATTPCFALNYCHVGVAVRGNVANTFVLGVASDNSISISTRTAGGSFTGRLGNTGGTNTANTDSSGHFILNRPDASSFDMVRNGSVLSTASVAANFLSTSEWNLLRFNGNYAPAGAELCVAHAGLYLDTARRQALEAVVTRFRTEIGAV